MKKFKDMMNHRWFANALAGCITVLFFLILSNIDTVFSTITQFLGYFSTVIAGCILAYLMNPLAMLYQRIFFKKIKKENVQWTLSIVLAVTTVVLFLTVIMSILIPQLFDSIVTFINNLDSYAKTLQGIIRDFSKSDDESSKFHNFVLSSENIINKAVSYIMDNSSKIIDISTNAGKSVVNWFIAFILSVYILGAKHRLKAGSKRLLKALLSDNQYQGASSFLSRCNNILNRYVIFDFIDGLIVGLVNAAFMSIFGMQYIGLVSVVVGVTNLVPTFGPLIGGIIGGFILLMVNPIHAIIFIVFTLILQTIDGYVLKPKLFGNTLGISGLWILIVIIFCGRVWGIVGILFAIPVAAITDYIYREILIPALEKSHKKRNKEEEAELAENEQEKQKE